MERNLQRYLNLRNDDFGKSLKEIMALLLLPAQKIMDRIQVLKTRHENSQSLTELLNFCEYKCVQIGTQNYSVFNSTDSISDAMERYSNRLKAKLGHKIGVSWDYASM